MKARLTTLPFLAAALLASATLHAEISPEFQKQVEEISQLLKPAETDTPELKAAKIRLRHLPTTLQAMGDPRQSEQFSQYADNLEGEGTAIPGLAEKLAEIRKMVQQEVQRREQADLVEGEALLKETGAILQSAKKPEELDGLLAKLSNQKISDYQRNPKLNALNRQIQSASQIVGNWQEYLIAKETGDSQAEMSKLQQVSQALSSNPIVPRSMVLRLMNPPARRTTPNVSALAAEAAGEAAAITIDSITAALTESGDAAAALKQLKELPASQRNRSDDSSLLRTVQSIEALRILEPSMAEGEVIANARTLNQNSQNRLIYNRSLDQILLNSIARNYGIEAPSAKTTTPRKVVEAFAEKAAAVQDWTRLRKAIGTLENFAYGSSGNDSIKRSNDLRLLSLLELAKAAEEHNDVEAAATAYVEAAGIDGFYIRRDIAYGKLADLKQKAPDKLEPILAKAEERMQRAETARFTAELESRDRRNTMAPNPLDRMGGRTDLSALKPLVQEVVAEFLKEKRLENAPPQPEPAAAKPKEPLAQPKDSAPKKE